MFKIFFDKLKSCEGIVDWAVLAAVALGAICVAVLSSNYVVVNNDTFSDFGDIADSYVDWARDNRPEILQQLAENMENNSYDYSGINPHWVENLYSGDVIGVLCDVSLLKDIIVSIHDFLSLNGEFSDDAYTYITPSADVSNVNLTDLSAAVKSYADSYYNINSDVNFISWHMQRTLQLYDSPKYIYLFDKAWPDGPPASWLCLIASDSPSPAYSDVSNFRCYSGTLCGRIDSSDGRVGDNSWNGCGVTNQSAVLIASFYYDPSLESSVVDSTSVVFNNSADSTGDFAQNPAGYADTVATSAAEDVITHYSDGKTDVKEKITFAFPITGSYPTEFEIDESRARELGLDDILADSPDDVYSDDPAESPAADSSSFMSKILAFLRGFWNSFINGIVEALRRFFVPPDDTVREVINDIRDDFVQKIGYEGFDINAAFGSGTPPEDVYLTDYPVAGGVGGKLIDFRFVIFAVDRMRGYIRGLFALFIFIYNLNQLFHFIGQAGAACGAWESYSHSSPSNIEDSKWNMFLNQAKNGRF